MSLKVLILKGLQGAGKSTWAKEQVKKEPGVFKRINKDDLRAMLDCSHHTDYNEKFVLETRDILIAKALDYGRNVIVDDTNFEPIHETRIREIVTNWNKEQESKGNKSRAMIEIKNFEISLEEAIERDKNREHSVGEKVIRRTYNQFLRPKENKMLSTKVEAPKYNPDLPDAIICDLDGTLALLNGRSPYDASTCENDLLNEPVAEILSHFDDPENLKRIKFIFVSGREDKYKLPTVNWLEKHMIYFDFLFMRPTGDTRKDAIIKQEIYEREIKDKYNVLFVLDDRNQTVAKWRELGLVCLQVAEGNF